MGRRCNIPFHAWQSTKAHGICLPEHLSVIVMWKSWGKPEVQACTSHIAVECRASGLISAIALLSSSRSFLRFCVPFMKQRAFYTFWSCCHSKHRLIMAGADLEALMLDWKGPLEMIYSNPLWVAGMSKRGFYVGQSPFVDLAYYMEFPCKSWP